MDREIVSLENLGRGAALEKFQDEWNKVVRNIVDPNTTMLKVSLKPDDDRSLCAYKVICTSSLAPLKEFKGDVFVGVERGEVVATEPNKNQAILPGFDGKKVVDMTGMNREGGEK